MPKRRFDDKATWRTDAEWGIDPNQPARSERIFDPNDTVTNDPTPGGIAGLTDTKKITNMTGTMYTDMNADPSLMVNKSYK